MEELSKEEKLRRRQERLAQWKSKKTTESLEDNGLDEAARKKAERQKKLEEEEAARKLEAERKCKAREEKAKKKAREAQEAKEATVGPSTAWTGEYSM